MNAVFLFVERGQLDGPRSDFAASRLPQKDDGEGGA